MKNRKYLILFIILLIVFFLLNYFINNVNKAEQVKEISMGIASEYIAEKEYKFNQSNDKNLIFIPINVYIIKFNDDKLSSARNEENINLLFDNANKIWSQADIGINITKIEFLTINDDSIYSSIERLYSHVIATGNYDENKINAYFAKTLHGPNGIALPGNIIMVADKTTVFDFRATSHEIGHVLGLQHVAPINRLMAEGVNGFSLTNGEIKVAKSNALNKFY